jgi:hypothetical protein
VAGYTASASSSVITGYITSATYSGEITREVTGDTVHTAFFSGTEIMPQREICESAQQDELVPEAGPGSKQELPENDTITDEHSSNGRNLPHLPIFVIAGAMVGLAGAGAYIALRHNVRIYEDNFTTLVAKDKITSKNKKIDLTPLLGTHFGIELEKSIAKSLDGQTIEIRQGDVWLNHKISYGGNVYQIDIDFAENDVQTIY